MIGTGWGLSPERIWWVYQAIVRPTMSHGAVAWAQKMDNQALKVYQATEKMPHCSDGSNERNPNSWTGSSVGHSSATHLATGVQH
jgi:hypothetical protein